jgi:hypothetical protein
MNELARRGNEERDRHIVRLLLERGRGRVFAVVGGTHVVMRKRPFAACQ